MAQSKHSDRMVADSLTKPEAPPKREPTVRIGFLVHDVSRMRRTVYDQAMRPLGVTRAQWWVLANLSRHPGGGTTQTDLARVLDVGKVTVGGLIDRLEASGHVERRFDPEDRRVRRIFITPRGDEVLEKMMGVSRELNRFIFRDITEAQVKIAEAVMHQMKSNLRDMLEGSGESLEEDG